MADNQERRTIEIIVNGQQVNASLKEMNAAAAVLYNQFNKLSADDPGRAKIIADYRSMKDRVAAVKTELTGVTQSTSLLKQGFANAFAMFTGGGIVALVQKVWGFLGSAKEEFQASAKSSADLEATLKATAHAAGLTAAEVRAIGEARAKVTLFDDETNRASAMLLTFKNIKKGVFEDAIPAIQDIATKMAGDGPADLKGASIQVGKALNDPVRGITALTKVGVTFTEQQKDQIKQMVKMGDTAGAQKIILAELNSEFGGAAEAARKAGGGMATLSMRWGEMKETVGGFVSEGLSKLSDWLGRVLNNAQPLWDVFTGLGEEVVSLWHEVSDLVEGLGLFGKEGDSAVSVAKFLTGAITLLLAPLRLVVGITRQLIDGFVNWYNSSERLRGILGGLGAAIVSLFVTIKDDAIKILGGVGDLVVGIFTLDKDKIAKGFKSALSATADVALLSGKRAAAEFLKGYEANKNNHITRTVRVETKEEKTAEGGTAASNGEAPGMSEKDKKAAEKEAKRKKAEAEKAAKAAEEAEIRHQEMLYDLAETAIKEQGDLRRAELAEIEFDAMRKALAVKGSEQEKNAAIALINADAHLKAQELQAKWDKEDADARQKAQDAYIEQQIIDMDEDTTRKADALEVMRAAEMLGEQEYQDQLYQLKRDGLQRELDLLEKAGKGQTDEAKKIRAALATTEKTGILNSINAAKTEKEKKIAIEQASMKAAGDAADFGIQLLGKDEEARKKHHSLYIALSTAKILMDGYQEVAAIWRYSAQVEGNAATYGVAGAVLGGIQTALAVGRTIMAISNLDEVPGYAAGGRTGDGMVVSPGTGQRVSPWGALMDYSGIRVGSNGKLTDGSGFAVAGVVHEDEYVIPKWLRQDPQVAAFEEWVEAKRLRGFYEGGRTSASSPASAPSQGLVALGGEAAATTGLLTEMLGELRILSGRLANVETWQSKLQVVFDVQGHRKTTDELKRVEWDSAIRKSPK